VALVVVFVVCVSFLLAGVADPWAYVGVRLCGFVAMFMFIQERWSDRANTSSMKKKQRRTRTGDGG
jgi:hypothetical protein